VARRVSRKGEVTQSETPEWEPLLKAVGRYATCDFMWMHEVELTDGTKLHAYKHIDTRRYVHLAADGAAFEFVSPNRYRPVDTAHAFYAAFATLGRLGVPEDQLAVTRAALDRLAPEDV
jgi:hypothetical protein